MNIPKMKHKLPGDNWLMFKYVLYFGLLSPLFFLGWVASTAWQHIWLGWQSGKDTVYDGAERFTLAVERNRAQVKADKAEALAKDTLA